jgi:hypothetical protein
MSRMGGRIMHTRPTFTVEQRDGEYWICIEEGPNEHKLADGSFGFCFAPGTTLEQAREIAQYMGEKLEYFVKH